MIRNFFVFFGIFCALTSALRAQNNIIDEVVWTIGDDAILKSEVEEQRLRAQYDKTPINGDPYCIMAEQIAINKLFLHQAKIDSISVNEAEVTYNVEQRLAFFISELGSREKMEEYFGKSTSALREELLDVARDQKTIQQVQYKLVENINPTPAEVRRYFNTLNKDSVPTVPTEVELQVVSIQPPIPLEEINHTKERLREFSERINNNSSDFSMLAKLYSEDTESAKRGGELGFMGRGQLVPEFAAVAFSLTDPKKVSRIVESEYGFHIIQLIEKRGDRVNVRHILLKPHVTTADRQKATQVLDSIANLVREGKMTFEQAVLRFSQDKNTVMNAGLMLNDNTGTSKFKYQDLPAEVAKKVYGMKIGEISEPFSMIDRTTNKEVVSVVKLKSKTEQHKANITDDYQLIKSIFEGVEREKFITEWIAQKQKETYIKIDPAWANCEFQYPGWIKK
jgi:peptidyl-prolyl cis-trans isomerase SurA